MGKLGILKSTQQRISMKISIGHRGISGNFKWVSGISWDLYRGVSRGFGEAAVLEGVLETFQVICRAFQGVSGDFM